MEWVEPGPVVDGLVKRVIGAAVAVHGRLGPGFLEGIYEEALCIELELRKIAFERQKTIAVSYLGRRIGEARLDLLIENTIVVELKSTDGTAPVHISQVLSYLRTADVRIGLLINFNVPRLQAGIRRVIYTPNGSPATPATAPPLRPKNQ